ncbi:MAG: DUF4097 domain-containing protein [bacterium]
MKIRKVYARNLVALVFLFFWILGSSSPTISQEIVKKGRYFVAEITKNFTVKPGGTLRIYDVRGDVRIETWAQNKVTANEIKKMDVFTREEAETVLKKSAASYEQRGNVVEIGGEYHSRDWITSTFEVKVPKTFNVDIETRGGDLSVTDLIGDVDLKTSGGDIDLDDIDGEIDARTSGGDITVMNSKQRVNLKTSGGDLRLKNIGGPLLAKTSGGDIILTQSEDKVDLNTSGGDIEITDAGGTVKAHTSGGDIDVNTSRGAVEVHTSGGDLVLRNIGGSLEASTSGGDIEGRSIKGNADVSTSGGSIKMKDVQGGVRAKTAGGDLDVEITLTDFAKEHGVYMRTAGGEISLTIPEKLPATIRAVIEITDRWEDYNIYSDFPLKISEEAGRERSERSRRRRSRRFIVSEGDINGGGDMIELFTTNGNIQINKLRK